MSGIALAKFLHLLGFAYWLGVDLAVFYLSYTVADREQPDAVRVRSAKALLALDLVPRVAMTLMLPLGLYIAWRYGMLPLSAATMAVVCLLSAGWLALVLYLHSHSKPVLATVDTLIRAFLIGCLLLTAILLFEDMPYWLSAKMIIFAGMIGCGLMIRLKLKRFGTGFARLVTQGADDQSNEDIRASLAASRPFVLLIWLGVLASAALGTHLL